MTLPALTILFFKKRKNFSNLFFSKKTYFFDEKSYIFALFNVFTTFYNKFNFSYF
ncbi:hypothetical protein MCSF7_00749 [Mycoplasmopsis columbina SF7]|uniref:Uncharacterized protein n=1 Tax=Mycoplasmopsis columbina SF7 TaxID=1037410 RepID=F9UJU3_9BACT|nr:hypothetical protein MCSF7_00749 [Mycoplasmopsis columbina SF7]